MKDDALNRLSVRRGSELPWAKLDEAKVAEINAIVEHRNALKRELREITNAKLAARYGVHLRTIDHVTTGENWGHVSCRT
ncbi:hypothetical protein [Salinicola rhizosphaerae]|uniref:Uncharacterized protein n=1 Tax=Salinicola rhizosphaerae TaxID=1443141 RepID=A0ABQ3EB49_9GAMM|nr:hypothetical protein [Salinicola rhizosphaerae]GHB30778.1 hypothetical protein GCM10009038_31990 [Salinicola rhizosphaerae]